MLSRKLLGISAFAGTIAVSLWTWTPAAWSGPPSPADDTTQYAPIQSISQDFGSLLRPFLDVVEKRSQKRRG